MRRRGMSLVEALVAALIVGGPLIACLQLVISNTNSAQFNQDQLSAEMYLQDILELLAATVGNPKTLVESEEGAGKASDILTELLEARAELPASFAPEIQKKLAQIAGKVEVRIDKDCGSPQGAGAYGSGNYYPGLHRIELSVRTPSGGRVVGFRFIAQPPVPGRRKQPPRPAQGGASPDPVVAGEGSIDEDSSADEVSETGEGT